jgi:hypothetical protein
MKMVSGGYVVMKMDTVDVWGHITEKTLSVCLSITAIFPKTIHSGNLGGIAHSMMQLLLH